VTLAEVKSAISRLRKIGEKNINYRQIFASIDQQRALMERAAAETKQSRRTQERTRRASEKARVGTLHRSKEERDSQDEDVGQILPYPVEEWS
jgi:hypothetical protein